MHRHGHPHAGAPAGGHLDGARGLHGDPAALVAAELDDDRLVEPVDHADVEVAVVAGERDRGRRLDGDAAEELLDLVDLVADPGPHAGEVTAVLVGQHGRGGALGLAPHGVGLRQDRVEARAAGHEGPRQHEQVARDGPGRVDVGGQGVEVDLRGRGVARGGELGEGHRPEPAGGEPPGRRAGLAGVPERGEEHGPLLRRAGVVVERAQDHRGGEALPQQHPRGPVAGGRPALRDGVVDDDHGASVGIGERGPGGEVVGRVAGEGAVAHEHDGVVLELVGDARRQPLVLRGDRGGARQAVAGEGVVGEQPRPAVGHRVVEGGGAEVEVAVGEHEEVAGRGRGEHVVEPGRGSGRRRAVGDLQVARVAADRPGVGGLVGGAGGRVGAGGARVRGLGVRVGRRGERARRVALRQAARDVEERGVEQDRRRAHRRVGIEHVRDPSQPAALAELGRPGLGVGDAAVLGVPDGGAERHHDAGPAGGGGGAVLVDQR